ncbi:MAG: restriction endonuclease subunit S [Phocaeicola plebeius]|uniref:restriction endonuclease subunit S n=1 Tax=Phocaeicola plebeius TaxID=310297 RepID=UPI003994180D
MKLADIIETFISGDWGEESPSSDTPNAVYCVRGADIVPITNHRFNDIPQRYVCQRTVDSKMLQAGDLIIEKSGGSPTQSTGRIVYVSDDLIREKGNIVCSNFCTALRVKSEWNPLYVFYYWQNVYNHDAFFNFEGKTSGIKNLQLDNALSAIEIEYLPLENQNKIVASLSAIDEKLKINRQINDNLEAMAKQLYDYWFVQFDFPNEEGKPYKSSGGAMVYNERLKREIPIGWEVENLIDFAEIKNGATPSTADEANYGGDIVWITPKDLSDQQSKFVYQGERNITKQGFDSCSTSMLPTNSVLMSSRAPIGLVSIAKHEVCTNQGFKSFIPKSISDSIYLYYYIKHHIKQIEQLGTGTTFKEVSRDDLCKFPILTIGAKNIYVQWIELQNGIADKQLALTKEIAALTKQRDELLPLLMNGQASINYHLSDD